MAIEHHTQPKERRSDQRLRALFAQLLDEQENDRQRVATELHGGIGQVMSLVKITLEAAAAHIATGSVDKAEKSIEWLIPIVVDALTELRRISADLRPSVLDDLGILATLTWFIRRLEKQLPALKVERDVHVEERDIPAALRITLFRILQESVAVLLKEEGVVTIGIHIRKERGALHLEVSSSLREVPLDKAERKAPIELAAIAERALIYGGKCKASTCAGAGGRINVSWSARSLAKFSASGSD